MCQLIACGPCYLYSLQYLHSLSIRVGGQLQRLSSHVVVQRAIVMVVHSHQHRHLQVRHLEGEMLIPLRIQVAMDHRTAVLEGRTLELDIRVTGAYRKGTSWSGCQGHCLKCAAIVPAICPLVSCYGPQPRFPKLLPQYPHWLASKTLDFLHW